MSQTFDVLLVEDSKHDIMATRRAWKTFEIPSPLRVVTDGEACLDYLFGRGPYEDPESAPRPGLVLLDINLPKLNGLEVLERIRAQAEFQDLPIVMLTTSQMVEDRKNSYTLGANAFVRKPDRYEDFAEAIQTIHRFWQLAAAQ